MGQLCFMTTTVNQTPIQFLSRVRRFFIERSETNNV